MSTNNNGTDSSGAGGTGTANAATTTTTSTAGTGGGGSTASSSNVNARTQVQRGERTTVYIDTSQRDFVGDEPRVGAVLAQKNERVDKKAAFDAFREKLCNFIVRELKHGADAVAVVQDMKDPMIDFKANKKPAELSDEDKKKDVEVAIQTQKIKNYVAREETLSSNIEKIYAITWGQCTESLKGIVRNIEDYAVKSKDFDVIWLLEQLKKITSGIDVKLNKRAVLHEQLLTFLTMRQGATENNDDYMKRFTSNLQVLELAGGGHILCSPTLMTKAGTAPTDDEIKVEEEAFKAMCLFKRADTTRFGELHEELKNGTYLGRDEYPTTTAATYDLLVRRSSGGIQGRGSGRGRGFDRGGRGRGRGRGRGGDTRVAFAQQATGDDNFVPGIDGTIIRSVTCWGCNQPGHVLNNCPSAATNPTGRGGRTGRQHVTVEYAFTQAGGISKSKLLLDTASTCNCTNNLDLVSNVRICEAGEDITVLGTGGSQYFNEIADLDLFPIPMHYNPDAMANIISFKSLADVPGVRITIDTLEERAICVHYQGTTYKFKECSEGLYCYDTDDDGVNEAMPLTQQLAFPQTVQENKRFFTQDEIKGAEEARRIQQLIGWPSTTTFKRIVALNMLRNCPITVDDIVRAEAIYGTPTPLCKGKMTRLATTKIKLQKIPLPLPISKHHQQVNIYIDIFYVNRIPFFHTKSGKVNFITSQALSGRSAKQIIDGYESIRKVYEDRGFIISDVHGDNEFNINKLKEIVSPATLNICAREEHVPIIERSIRTVKERSRSSCHSLPYRRYPKIMTISLVESMTKWLNTFPTSNGISSTMSPAAIVLGRHQPDMGRKRIGFGSYAMVHIGTTNNMKRRSVPAIALQESNDNSGYYFMSLFTGRELHSNNWDELPIDEEVIAKVEQMAKDQDQPFLPDKYPMFEWSPGTLIEDEDDETVEEEQNEFDEQYELQRQDERLFDDDEENENEDNNDNNELNNEIEEENNEENDEQEEEDIDNDENEEDEQINIIENEDEIEIDLGQNNDDEYNMVSNDENEEENEELTESEESTTEQNETISEQENETNNEEENESIPDEPAVRRSSRRNAGQGVNRLFLDPGGKVYTDYNNKMMLQRTQRKKKYALVQMLKKGKGRKKDEYMAIATKVMFTQMTAKKGMKLFGEQAVAAMFKEYKQLNEGAVPGKPVLAPIDPDTLSREEKRQSLEAVNLIKEKRCGKIKGRTCANGSRQREFLKEDESVSSPTCAMESLIATLVIDAYEGRDVGVYDVPGAFLQSDIPKDKKLLMTIRGEFVDIMCDVNPEYKEHVRVVNGKKVLYVQVLQAIYGCIESALLWYNFYATTLEKEGFKINPYDRCVANKMIKGKQCTLVWYVDDNKVSHADPAVVTDVIKMVSSYFGELAVTRGDEHTFLGIKFKIRKDKKIEVSMKEQLEEAITLFEESGDKVDGEVCSPAAKHLFTTDENGEELDEKRKEIFHSVTAKLLFCGKRVRPDIDPTVAFLCTRVSKSCEDDWKKLKRLLCFIKSTIDDPRIIGATSLTDLYTWVDAAYGVHDNMRSQTGGAMSFGIGILHGRSSKQKLNVKSSTEAEVVGLSEYLPYNIWMIYFLMHQGYKIVNNILYQDNQSAIRMEKNGRNSCTGNSRHIHIRYFFVKDRVDKKEVKIEYCPTEQMLADFFTKPLQGSLFRKFRDVIMGYKPMTDLYTVQDLPIKERVEIPVENRKMSENTIVSDSSRKENRNVSWADVVKNDDVNGRRGEKNSLNSLVKGKSNFEECGTLTKLKITQLVR